MSKRIFYINLIVQTKVRGNKFDKPRKVEGMVASGTEEEIKNDSTLKRRILSRKLNYSKNNVDESKIRIMEVEIITELGLGYMKSERRK